MLPFTWRKVATTCVRNKRTRDCLRGNVGQTRCLNRLCPAFIDTQSIMVRMQAAVARSQLSPLVRVMSAPDCLRVLFERAFTSEGASSVQVRLCLSSG